MLYSTDEITSISILGVGKIAHSLIPAIINSGYKIDYLITRKKLRINELKAKFGIEIILLDEINSLSNIGLLFLTVPDDAIIPSIEHLNKIPKLNIKTIVHFSGTITSIDLKKSLKEKTIFEIAGFHIMQTFPDNNAIDLRGEYSVVESENETIRNLLTKFGHRLGLRVSEISSEDKKLYHLCGVIMSNFIVGNSSVSSEIISTTENFNYGIEFLKPIVLSTIKNSLKLNPHEALSGPVERGDLGLIKNHLENLNDFPAEIRLFYLVNSLNLLRVAEKKNGKSSKYDLIRVFIKAEIKKEIQSF